MDIVKKIKQLNLSKGSYMVMGSGIMAVLGIKPANDVDLLVSKNVYEQKKAEGWAEFTLSNGETVLRFDVYDIGYSWFGVNLGELLKDSVVIDGVPFMSLERLISWKEQQCRPKDKKHIKLINKWIKNNKA